MSIKNIEIQDSDGNIYYPHTNASVVKNGSTTVAEQLKEIANKVDNIKIADGTTTQKGIVQLNNTTNSTSITQAATANAVKLAMDRANEAFISASNGKTYIAGKVGNVTGSNTFTQIGDRVQIDKNDFATQLNAKNVSASGNEALASLVAKIASISIKGMGGKRFVSGTATSGGRKDFIYFDTDFNEHGTRYDHTYVTVGNLNFTPRNAIFWAPYKDDKISNVYITILIDGLFCTNLQVMSIYGDGLIKPIIEGNSLTVPFSKSGINVNYIIFE